MNKSKQTLRLTIRATVVVAILTVCLSSIPLTRYTTTQTLREDRSLIATMTTKLQISRHQQQQQPRLRPRPLQEGGFAKEGLSERAEVMSE